MEQHVCYAWPDSECTCGQALEAFQDIAQLPSWHPYCKYLPDSPAGFQLYTGTWDIIGCVGYTRAVALWRFHPLTQRSAYKLSPWPSEIKSMQKHFNGLLFDILYPQKSFGFQQAYMSRAEASITARSTRYVKMHNCFNFCFRGSRTFSSLDIKFYWLLSHTRHKMIYAIRPTSILDKLQINADTFVNASFLPCLRC